MVVVISGSVAIISSWPIATNPTPTTRGWRLITMKECARLSTCAALAGVGWSLVYPCPHTPKQKTKNKQKQNNNKQNRQKQKTQAPHDTLFFYLLCYCSAVCTKAEGTSRSGLEAARGRRAGCKGVRADSPVRADARSRLYEERPPAWLPRLARAAQPASAGSGGWVGQAMRGRWGGRSAGRSGRARRRGRAGNSGVCSFHVLSIWLHKPPPCPSPSALSIFGRPPLTLSTRKSPPLSHPKSRS